MWQRAMPAWQSLDLPALWANATGRKPLPYVPKAHAVRLPVPMAHLGAHWAVDKAREGAAQLEGGEL